MLWAAAVEQGFTTPMWMTFKQSIALVRKGEKGTLVVYANTIMRAEEDGEGNEAEAA